MKINKMKVLTIALNAIVISGMASVAFAAGTSLPASVVTAIDWALSAVQAVGVFVAIGMLTFAGFKFLTAGAGEKAKAKDMLVPMVIGAILVIFATSLAKWIWGGLQGGGSGT